MIIKYLENLSLDEKKRIYFNFNLRFSELKKILDKYLSLDIIGKPIQINIVASMGLAFKEKYKQNWRSDGEQNMHNIIENVSIHWISSLLVRNKVCSKLSAFLLQNRHYSIFYYKLRINITTHFNNCTSFI